MLTAAPTVRAKFKCYSITTNAYSGVQIVMKAVCADEVPENQRFHKATPNGELAFTIDNASAAEQFEAGKDYYLDFTPVS